ncbi:YhdP family protein [Shewanella aestuarii]|uniref:TIGR02099 family protein n=1 Tax=Shewanella aestuarii TaxID=1028752 RepID=A0A6G9QHK7_9GAMM|nr:YhdP family protein [Shewanella aestuarii]QIR13381.1 TIGR02099 family protein [Shewanella aestuarii]
MSGQRLATLGRIIWQILAILLVLFALGVSLIRGLLPHVPEVRQELLSYVQQNYGVKLQIGSLSAKWQAYGPALTVENLVLPVQDNLPMTLISKQVSIKLDFWQSLRNLSLQIEKVSFDKVDIAIHFDKFPDGSSTSNQPQSSDWLYALLLEQLEHFEINDVTIQLLSTEYDFSPIYIQTLNWLNQDNLHRAQGLLYIDNDASENESLSLRIALEGNGYQPESIAGQIYLNAAALDIGEWASRRTNPMINQDQIDFEGVVNFDAWLTFANRNIQDGLLQFKPSWLQWADSPPVTGQPSVISPIDTAKASTSFQRFEIRSGALTWQDIANGWHIQSHELVIESNQQQLPELDVSFGYQNEQLFGRMNLINAQMLQPLLPLIPNLGRKQVQLWHDINLQGDIGPLQVYKASHKPWQARVEVSQFQWRPIQHVPGLKPIDMQLAWNGQQAILTLPAQEYHIDFAGGFKAPLQLSGEGMQLQYDVADRQLMAPHIAFANSDIHLQAGLNLRFVPDTHMALAANLSIQDVANVRDYFPLMAMSPNLVDYLEAGLQAGRIDDAKVVWNGLFKRYPYVESDGVFQADFIISEGKFQFQPDWPAVTNLDLHALFENKLMDLTILSGKLGQVAVDGAKVVIPELGAKSLLKVEADLTTDAKYAVQVINVSPLKDSVGETLAVVNISKTINTQLDLAIPLYEGDKPLSKGTVRFNQNPVYITKPGVQLNQVSGEISFINNLVSGQDLTAKLFKQPLSFSFATTNRSGQLALDVDFEGRWDIDKFPASFTTPLSDYYQGQFDWTGELMMMFGDQGYSLRAQAESELQGVSLTLPLPYTKQAKDKKRLTAELIGDNKASSLSVKLADQAEFWAGFSQDSDQLFEFYELMLGRHFKLGDQLTKQGGQIYIDFEKAHLADWQPIINRFTAKAAAEISADHAETENRLFPDLAKINAKIAEFELLGQRFNKLNLSATPQEHVWRFDVTSEQFDGRVDFYPSWREQGLKVVADKLYLSFEPKKPNETQFSPAEILQGLPPLAVDVDDFKFYGKSLGHLQMQANPTDKGYRFQTVSLTHPNSNMSLQANGTWLTEQDGMQTQFDIKLHADKFNELSDVLGINPGLQDAPLDLTGQISWQNSPYNFSLETLDGDLKFDFGKGHLSEISDKGARLFSLFSLDSIVRKLSFDFSDVFGKGLYFNSFKGSLVIDNGVVKTTDTEMDALAGSMKVRGYTDLTTQSLNYDIRFLPQLASSVPTVVLLSTSAWTLGIGAFALTKVLEPVIEVISEIRFRLTGTMANPQMEELERKSKEIEIPESILRENGIEPLPKEGLPTEPSAHEEPLVEKKPSVAPQPTIPTSVSADSSTTNVESPN